MTADPLKILSHIHLHPLPGLDWLFPETCMMKRASSLLQRLRDLGLLAEKLELARKSWVSFYSLLSHLPPLSLENKGLSSKASRLFVRTIQKKEKQERRKINIKEKKKKKNNPMTLYALVNFYALGRRASME